MSFLAELRRRNVFRAAAAYVAVAWLVVQVAETTFPAFGFSDAALRTLIIVLAVGFVPAVALAWVFELTPEGLKRDRDLEPGGELSVRTNRLLDRGIVVVLALGVAYFAFDKFVLGPARDAALVQEARQEGRAEALVESFAERSIAVLPFENLSTDPEQAFFAAGIAEEILHLLERVPGLRVISRSSSFHFADRSVPVPEIARTLSVSHVLDGSVRKSGDRVRVTAQLIDARADTQLWSESWERPLDNVFAIQDEIAGEVASRMEVELAEAPRSRRVDPVAFELHLKGRHLIESYRADALPEAEVALRRAVEIQPDYADAWLALSRVYYMYFHAYRDDPGESPRYSEGEAYRLSSEALDRALDLDPDNPVGLTAKAVRLWYDDPPDEKTAAELFERAIAMGFGTFSPSFAFSLGQLELGARLAEFALQQDPLCNWCRLELVQAYSALGRYDEAEVILQSLEDGGSDLAGDYYRAEFLIGQGKPEEALDLLAQRPPRETTDLRVLALHQLGRDDAAEALLDEAAAALDPPTGTTNAGATPLQLAALNAQVGRIEEAFGWLQRGVAGGCRLFRINFGPTEAAFASHQDDPRWQAVARRCNRSPEQIAEIGFDPVLPGPGDPR